MEIQQNFIKITLHLFYLTLTFLIRSTTSQSNSYSVVIGSLDTPLSRSTPHRKIKKYINSHKWDEHVTRMNVERLVKNLRRNRIQQQIIYIFQSDEL